MVWCPLRRWLKKGVCLFFLKSWFLRILGHFSVFPYLVTLHKEIRISLHYIRKKAEVTSLFATAITHSFFIGFWWFFLFVRNEPVHFFRYLNFSDFSISLAENPKKLIFVAAILDFWRPFWIFLVANVLFLINYIWTIYVASLVLVSPSARLGRLFYLICRTMWFCTAATNVTSC